MQVSEKLNTAVDLLGLKEQAKIRKSASRLLQIIAEVTFRETESADIQEAHIPNLTSQFHSGVLTEIAEQQAVRENAFKMSMAALNEFNEGNSIGRAMFASIAAASGNAEKIEQQETERAELFQELRDRYSDYLSGLGLEIIRTESPHTIIGPISMVGEQGLSEFFDKVQAIVSPDQTFIAEDDKDRELESFVEELSNTLPDLPTLQREDMAQRKLVDYYFNTYADPEVNTTRSSDGTLTQTPASLSLNINDGKKLVAFLAALSPNSVDADMKTHLESIRQCVLNTFREPFSSGLSNEVREQRMEGLYSSIRQFKAISTQLERLGLDTTEIQEYMEYSRQRILPQFVTAKNRQLLLRHDDGVQSFYSANWHGDSSVEQYQKFMDRLLSDLEFVGTAENANTLHQSCISTQVANLDFAIDDMQQHLSRTRESELCKWWESDVIEQKLEIAINTRNVLAN